MYQIPIQFVKVGPGMAICATRIIAIMTTDSFQAREAIKNERRAGTLINACGTSRARCACYLDNGTVVASPYSTDTILKHLDKADDAPQTVLEQQKNEKQYKKNTFVPPENINNDCDEIEQSYDEEFVLEEQEI